MMKLALLALSVMLPAAAAYGQTGEQRDPPQPKSAKVMPRPDRHSDRLPLAESAREIKATRPEVSSGTLYDDMFAVVEARPVVRDVFRKRGFLQREADDALLYGWEQLRITQLKPTETLSPEVLARYVSGYGKVIIRTKPTGASVVIGEKKLTDKTDAVAWSSGGPHTIRLSMDGYESVEGNCAVKEGETTVFERTLKPVKPKTSTPIKKKS